jgi:nucleoid DNA-binding protein
VTKKEMAKVIGDELNITTELTKAVIQRTFAAIIETLETDGRIELRNFGVFEVRKRKPRKARNPRTGEVVQVPSRKVVSFKPGKEMAVRIGQQPKKRSALVGAGKAE